MNIIEVEHLRKYYKTYKRFPGLVGAFKTLFTREFDTTKGVDDISFTIKQGESVGYLGPNGAGKSTMIKMLTGILVPTSGQVTVNGLVPFQNRKKLAKNIGVVFGQRSQLWWDIPVVDSFELHKYIYKISETDYQKRLNIYIDMLDMSSFMNKAVRQLSLGQRMRAEIALALIHDPQLLFLDEPTIGLDVVGKHKIREFLAYINKEKNTTIILTTHDLKDIEEVCSRIMIVNQGKSHYDGPVDQLSRQITLKKKVTIEFVDNPGEIHIPKASLIRDEGSRKILEFEEGVDIIKAINGISGQHLIKDISIESADIEEVIRLYFNQISEKAM
ncbi:ATP-binding cassette domain-containing protein [Bacillaceae bacterium SIJ1]|uniref:ABC transporter ATP-binding protein n=1 Tax=Litoribacterium kuwaitense TaxID=1398745 RepID=UPI0013EAA887|nr:ATP-binding cassette domain-containing protein [Litoribacterium kuwaitense]NGP46738.1 ATP-binding cassette domain-containing protein [Litoribacterium kuwaitense]